MKRYIISMLLLFCLGSIAEAQFTVYREFFFTGQPSASYFDGLGLRASRGVYEDAVTGGSPPVEQSLMASTAQSAANAALYQKRMWYDIEYLDTDAGRVGTTQAAANARELAKFIGWAKKAAPTLDIGLYSQVPVTDLWMSSHLAQRQSYNNLIQVLADSLDFLCPSIYLYYSESTISYASYAVPMIQEAKRLAKGKKVFPFISPGYHPSGDFANQYASKAVWANVLKSLKDAGADGVFIFAGNGAMGSQPGSWSYVESSGWWQATKEFLQTLSSGSGQVAQGDTPIVDPENGTVSSTETESAVPKSYDLAQNFPNPFNPSTTIRFSLPVGAHVRLSVFNSLGQEVRILVDDVRDAGYHEVRLDAADMASGVYFYRLVAGEYIQTRKLSLVK